MFALHCPSVKTNSDCVNILPKMMMMTIIAMIVSIGNHMDESADLGKNCMATVNCTRRSRVLFELL